MNIGIFIFEGTEELDFAGPYEVLTQWAQQAADKREIFVFTIARSTDPVRCAHGLRVLPDYAWDDAPSLDLLLFPGGRVRQFLEDEQTLDWVRSIRATGALMTSVCTGAHVYASDIQYETPVAV